MIEIKKSEYKTITTELIKSDIDSYTKNIKKWRNSEGIPKPYPNYLIVETIVENDEDWQLIDDPIKDTMPSHDELTDVKNKKYNYLYARRSEYGDLVDQIEFITENGLEAWQARVAGIKNLYPKPNK
tara:strand:- start:5 stop:385 length:381 start_codon:yes stop_codon:yes gene_type:complete